jgi:hypothetical protein
MGSNGKHHPSNLITVLDTGSAKTVALICGRSGEAGRMPRWQRRDFRGWGTY